MLQVYNVGLGIAYAKAGQKENAWRLHLRWRKTLIAWNAWGLAEVYAALEDKDKAIYFLEEAYRMHQDFIPWIRSSNSLKILRDDPRFKDMVSRLNLPE